MKPNMTVFSLMLLGLASCSGGGDDAVNDIDSVSDISDIPPISPTTDASTLYFGHYSEDPIADPNDPTAGIVYVYLPSTDSTFNGEFYFSYVGCIGSYDTGQIVAALTGDSVNGTWSGDIDGFISTGTFNADSSDDGNTFSGNWTRDGGSVSQDFGLCAYTIAGYGELTLYKIAGTAFAISVDLTDPFTPIFSWTTPPSGTQYKLDVFDKLCLENGGSIDACLMWSDFGFDTGSGLPDSIIYGVGIYPAEALISGNSYVVTFVSYDFNGVVFDFGSNEFSVP